MPMFHLLKRLIFNELKHKNETDSTNRYNMYTSTRACARMEYW